MRRYLRLQFASNLFESRNVVLEFEKFFSNFFFMKKDLKNCERKTISFDLPPL